MGSNATHLATIKHQILERIEEITAQPKPTYNIDGQQVLWGAYFDSLTKQLAAIDAAIASADPYEEVSYGLT